MFSLDEISVQPVDSRWTRFRNTLLRTGSGWTVPVDHWSSSDPLGNLPPAFRNQVAPPMNVYGSALGAGPLPQNANQVIGQQANNPLPPQAQPSAPAAGAQNQAAGAVFTPRSCFNRYFGDHPKIWIGILILALMTIIAVMAYAIDATEPCGPEGLRAYSLDKRPRITSSWDGDKRDAEDWQVGKII